MNIGERLKLLREQRELTLEQVGKEIGVKKTTVQRYETGEIDIKRTIAIKLAKILNTNPSYIMGWTDCADPNAKFYSDIEGNLPQTSQEKLSEDIFASIGQQHGRNAQKAFSMYVQLDPDDQGEIRGEMKQMLKADKYKDAPCSKGDPAQAV